PGRRRPLLRTGHDSILAAQLGGGGKAMTVIDADAHVHESDHTWDFIAEAEQQFRPMIFPQQDGSDRPSHWIVDGMLQPHGGNAGAATPAAYRYLEDVPGRL